MKNSPYLYNIKLKQRKMAKKETNPYRLTIEEALSLIEVFTEKRKKRAHTFEGSSFVLIGCDMDLSTIKEEMKKSDSISLAGPNMCAMGHGIAYFRKGYGYLFVKTDMEKIKKIFADRNLEL